MVCKMRVMCFIVTALLILLQITCQNDEEKQFLCVDESCSKPISEFKVVLAYMAPDSSEKITAQIREEGVILAKPLDIKPGILKVKIKDREGFLSHRYIREGKQIVKKSELIKVKLAVPGDTVAIKNIKETPKSINGINSDDGIVQDESEDNATIESQSSSAPTIDQSNESNYTVDQLSGEPQANDSSSIEIDDLSSENLSDEDSSAEFMKQIKPTLNPLFKNAAFKSKEVLDEDIQIKVTSNEKSHPIIESDNKKGESTKTPTSKTIIREDSGNLNLIGTFKANIEKSENDNISSQNPENFVTVSPPINNDESIDNQTVSGTVENVDVQNDTVASLKTDEVKKKTDKLENDNSESNLNNLPNSENITSPDQNLEIVSGIVENAEVQNDTVISSKTDEVKEETDKLENNINNLPNSENITSPDQNLETVSGIVENADVQNDTVVSSKTDEVKQETDKLKNDNSESNLNNLPNSENITSPDQNSETVKPIEEIEDDSKPPSESVEPVKSPDDSSSEAQTVISEDQSQKVSQPEANVSEESTNSQIITADVNIESKNDSSSIPESNSQDSESKSSSVDVSQNATESPKSINDTDDKVIPKLVDHYVPLVPQSVESDGKNDEKLANTSEANLQLDLKETDNVTDSTSTSERFKLGVQVEHTTETKPLDSITPKAIPYGIPPPSILTETATEAAQPESTESGISEGESISPPSSTANQPESIQPVPIVTQDVSEPTGSKLEHFFQQSPEEPPKSDAMASTEQFESESIEILPKPINIPSEFDVDQKHGLNDFIHAPRNKVNENEIENFESHDEKSIYETIQDYLPDFSGFQVNDILPVSSIQSVKSFFDFGFSSQKQEEQEFCSAEQFCGTDRLNSFMDDQTLHKSSERITLPLLGEVNHEDREKIIWICGIISVCTLALILLLSMINYVTKNNKNSFFVSRINQLENKLLIATQEIVTLQDQLADADFQTIEKQNVVETKRITEVYEHKINQYKKRIVELDDKVLYLEQELENVSSSALEMHKLLENSLTTQAHSKAAIDEVDTLRLLTENQEIQIEELRREINSIVTENQCLKVDNEMDKSTIKRLEKECSLQIKKNLELSEKNRNLTLQLDKEIEGNNTLESNYKSEIYQLRSKLEDIEMNLKRSEFQVQELNRAFIDKQDGKSPAEVQAACDDMQLKIQISTLEAMNVELGGQLKEEKNARRMLEDHVGDVIKELNNLKKTYEISEKERNEAVTKLQVLTQYFKDKEAQLHKDLEAKDKLYTERESKDQSLSQKLATMRDEISNLKMQNEELRKEILDQETSFKTQLANAEQKTREHWFALRQAERKYKECEQEASNLRNKILLLETRLSSLNQKGDDKNSSGINGDMPSMIYHTPLSPDLLQYPSASDFIPPPPSPIPSHSPDFFPPEPLYSPDERLPPLGGRRAPSPPPPIISDDDGFTPPPPIMKYPPGRSRNTEPPVPSYSRRTPPPGARHRSQFKPRQPRSSIDSPSSGMSLESLDKSGR